MCAHVCSWQGQILGMICTAMNTRKIYFDFVRQVIVKTWIPFGHLTGTAVVVIQWSARKRERKSEREKEKEWKRDNIYIQ